MRTPASACGSKAVCLAALSCPLWAARYGHLLQGATGHWSRHAPACLDACGCSGPQAAHAWPAGCTCTAMQSRQRHQHTCTHVISWSLLRRAASPNHLHPPRAKWAMASVMASGNRNRHTPGRARGAEGPAGLPAISLQALAGASLHACMTLLAACHAAACMYGGAIAHTPGRGDHRVVAAATGRRQRVVEQHVARERVVHLPHSAATHTPPEPVRARHANQAASVEQRLLSLKTNSACGRLQPGRWLHASPSMRTHLG